MGKEKSWFKNDENKANEDSSYERLLTNADKIVSEQAERKSHSEVEQTISKNVR